jgi:hypothetical protein
MTLRWTILRPFSDLSSWYIYVIKPGNMCARLGVDGREEKRKKGREERTGGWKGKDRTKVQVRDERWEDSNE